MCDIDSFIPLSPLLHGTKYRQTTENTHRSVLLFSQKRVASEVTFPQQTHVVRHPAYIARGIKQ